ncbi:MAG: ABC transporter permease [Anaerolineales bacterium]|nr:ABC transporter permease [Anaerolineales bacterium]MCZ2122870.1 ABC transporter permease [Anaerolineales bacterium]
MSDQIAKLDSSKTSPSLVIQPQRGWVALELKDLWRYRDLLLILTWRDIKVRYAQTFLGAAWAVLQPLLTMAIFSLIFGKFAKLPSDGIPYPLFTFTALLPWQLFAFALTNASNSLINSEKLISKVYFPRLVIPISSVLPGLADFAISFIALIGMLIYYEVPLSARLLSLPVFLILAILSALAVGLWFSALNVEYRDIRYVVPFLTLFWQYATPIAYASSLIPEKWRLLYSLNPMTGVVEGFRWALLGGADLNKTVLVSALIIILLFLSGMAYFKRMESTFADVI